MTRVRAALGIDAMRLLGAWHIVATTLPFWRGKRGPMVTYAPRADGAWSDELTWRDARNRTRRLSGVDRADTGEPGRFVWRGAGLLAILRSEWAFVALADDAAWCATWFSRASFGLTPEGMDVYARDRDRVRAADVIASLQTREDLPRMSGWYETAR